jgi:TatD DNase family protein
LDEEAEKALKDSLSTLKTSRICVYGTRSNDWPAVELLHRLGGAKVIPGYALHPWFVETIDATSIPDNVSRDNVLDVLRGTHFGSTLLEYLGKAREKGPVMLAEFGLDKAATKPGTKAIYDFPLQLKLFKLQLLLGAELGLPVSIHCVRAPGPTFDVFKSMKAVPERIMMHSFAGKDDFLRELLNNLPKAVSKKLWFSISPLNLKNGTPDYLAKIPEDRLLLESDVHSVGEIDAAMWMVCEAVAEARGWSMNECAEKTGRNARAFLGDDG